MRHLVWTTLVAAMLACTAGCQDTYESAPDSAPPAGTPPADTMPPATDDDPTQPAPGSPADRPVPGSGAQIDSPPPDFSPAPDTNAAPTAGDSAFDPPAAGDAGQGQFDNRDSSFTLDDNARRAPEGGLELESAVPDDFPREGFPQGDVPTVDDAPVGEVPADGDEAF